MIAALNNREFVKPSLIRRSRLIYFTNLICKVYKKGDFQGINFMENIEFVRRLHRHRNDPMPMHLF